ncbi:hypothetical protein BH11PSE2_BH11PSE2_20180 [soil metagenome]
MQCVCGVTNADGAKFCSECGSKLEAGPPLCPSCGTENAQGAKFCANCGHAIAPASDETMAAVDEAEPAPKPEPAAAIPLPIPPQPREPGEKGGADWELDAALKPIKSLARAKTMAQVGAAACAIIAAISLLGLLGDWGKVSGLLVGARLVNAALFGALAWGLWRGSVAAGWLATLIYGGNIVIVAIALVKTPGSISAGSSAIYFGTFILAPLAILGGLRGAMAWSKFRNAGGEKAGG